MSDRPSDAVSTFGYARAKRLSVIGALVLFLGYVLPYRTFGRTWVSLLLGPIGGGFHPSLQQLIFTPLEGIGILALLLIVSFAKVDDATRILGTGVRMGVGVVEGLYFLGLLGNGLVSNTAIWVGFIGAMLTLAAGLASWTARAPSS